MSRFNPNRIPREYSRYQQDRANEMSRAMLAVTQRYIERYKDRLNSGNITSTLGVIIVPFMQNILNRYSEEDFHRAMAQKYVDEEGTVCYGFDFITDWRNHHTTAFPIMMYVARQFRRNLNFDIGIATGLIMEIIQSWRWQARPHERHAIAHLLYRIKRLIFTV